MSNTIPFWTTPSGAFILQHAYHLARPSRASLLSHKYIWLKFQRPDIQLFLWKLYHGALPIVDNLMRLAVVLPMRCLFCQKDATFLYHILLLCPEVHVLWDYVGALLDVTPPTTRQWRSYLLMVWTAAPTNFLGDVQIIFTCVLLWHIWKI